MLWTLRGYRQTIDGFRPIEETTPRRTGAQAALFLFASSRQQAYSILTGQLNCRLSSSHFSPSAFSPWVFRVKTASRGVVAPVNATFCCRSLLLPSLLFLGFVHKQSTYTSFAPEGANSVSPPLLLFPCPLYVASWDRFCCYAGKLKRVAIVADWDMASSGAKRHFSGITWSEPTLSLLELIVQINGSC